MAFLYQLTTLIDSITYTTKPYICEYPLVKDHIFNNFTRGIRTRPSTRKFSELGINRTHEGLDSSQMYDVQMRFATYSDQVTTLEELWTGLAAVDPSEYFTWIAMTDAEEAQDDGEFVLEFVVIGKRHGKQIGGS